MTDRPTVKPCPICVDRGRECPFCFARRMKALAEEQVIREPKPERPQPPTEPLFGEGEE
jgi:hypothetical protein